MPARTRKPTPRNRLKACRAQTHLSQRELAILAGCTTATIGDIESGRNRTPSHDKVVGIIRALRDRGCAAGAAENCFPVKVVPRMIAATVSRRRKAS